MARISIGDTHCESTLMLPIEPCTVVTAKKQNRFERLSASLSLPQFYLFQRFVALVEAQSTVVI
jgi:hypothetical protein